MKSEERVKLGRDSSLDDVTGWTTTRLFCAGVGLVREFQRDDAGFTTYTMDLVSYKLSG